MSTAASRERASGPTAVKLPPTNSVFGSVGESASARTEPLTFGFHWLAPPFVVSISARWLRVSADTVVKSPPAYSQRCVVPSSASARTVLLGFGWKEEATE